MQIKTRYYEEIFADFREQFPMYANDAVEYRPKHNHAIRVTLRGGEQIDYNIQTKTFRRVGSLGANRPSEITDEYCRSVIATNLAEVMRMRGMNQAALSERTGLSTAIISKYLNGRATPSATNLKRIAMALNCDLEELCD